jgi:2,3-dihydroxyphenylpropionate 1,2-dioxygenase
MAKLVAGVASSHSPLMEHSAASDPEQERRYRAALAQAKDIIANHNVDAIVIVAPDHYRTFFYLNMPSVCIGVGTCNGWGDWGFPKAALKVQCELAYDIINAAFALGLTPSYSTELPIDHGGLHAVAYLDPNLAIPIVPILINCFALPLAPPVLSYRLGEAINKGVQNWTGGSRVAVIGSGGLSHWPPIPRVDSSDPKHATMVQVMLHGRDQSMVESDERRRIEAAVTATRADLGQIKINPDWDRRILRLIEDGRGSEVAAFNTEQIEKEGGNGGQEIRTWLSVLGAFPGCKGRVLCYEPIKEWITGMGIIAIDA